MNSIVIDANIVIKLFLEGENSPLAYELMEYLIVNKVQILAPELLLSESLDVLISKGFEAEGILDFFSKQLNATILIQSLEMDAVGLAVEMVQRCTASFPDCIYHAIAIVNDTRLITSDNKHFNKTEKQYGHITLLENWNETIAKP